MERCLIWYVLSLKNYLKKRSSYLTVLGMICLLWILSSISIPSATNMKVGLACNDSRVASEIAKRLESEKDDFYFVEYQDEALLIEDVISGTIDCGFSFVEDFDDLFYACDTKDSITYYATSFSTKGDVLKETVFSVYFELYSENVLLGAEEEIFGNIDSERMEGILANYQEYLGGNDIFQMDIELVDEGNNQEVKENQTSPIKGIVGITIFLVMFFAYGETQLKDGDNVELALNRRARLLYRYIKMIAAATFPFVIGIVVILATGEAQNVFVEIAKLVIFILLSGLWMLVVGRWLGKAQDLPVWLLSIILVHLLICPIFFDFATYIPAIKWIRYALPLGIYFTL